MKLLPISIFLFISAALSPFAHADFKSDVLIYGGTPAGISAGIALHRAGVKSIIIEPSNHIGGMMTGGLSAADVCAERTIGGISREIFSLIGKHYNTSFAKRFEPHVAQEVFKKIIADNKLEIIRGFHLQSVTTKKDRITAIHLDDGRKFEAAAFIDASYEGDLLAKAGVAYTIGRESVETYNESMAGVRPDGGPIRHQFKGKFSGRDSNGKLLPGIHLDKMPSPGSADKKTPAYNYRLCVTKRADIRIPFSKPNGYSRKNYEILARLLGAAPKTTHKDLFTILKIHNGKYDLNNGGPFSTNLIGGSWEYPEGDKKKREQIAKEHKTYIQGLLYFLSSDLAVPKHLRQEISSWGYCGDEFKETGNFPPQLYVRQARRMVGEYILTQEDLFKKRRKIDSVGMASCPIESHHVQRVLLADGTPFNEGHLQTNILPYQIPLRSLLPKKNEISNLIVPVALSASHVPYTSLRMEPVYMILGESAGVAASIVVRSQLSFHDLDSVKLRNTLLKLGQKLGDLPKSRKGKGQETTDLIPLETR